MPATPAAGAAAPASWRWRRPSGSDLHPGGRGCTQRADELPSGTRAARRGAEGAWTGEWRRDRRPVRQQVRGDPHPRGARPGSHAAPRARRAAPRAARGQSRTAGRAVGGRPARLPARDRGDPGRPRLAGRAARARAGRPAGRDHRADGPEDDDQRAELRREGVAGRLRGRQHAAVGQHDHRPAQPEGRARPDHRLHQRGGQVLPAAARCRAGHHRGPAPRLASGRKAPAHRR